MNQPWRLLAVLGIGLTASCEFDLTEVDAFTTTRSRLSLQLDVPEHAGPLQLTAWFQPGRDTRGDQQAVADDSLRVNGVAVGPTEIGGDGTRTYRVMGLDALSAAILIRAPALVGESPPVVEVEPIRVNSPDRIEVSRAGTLELRLTGLQSLNESATGFWMLRVYPEACAGRDQLSLSGGTIPRSVLKVPADLLPGSLRSGSLQYRGSSRHSVPTTGSYDIAIDRFFHACIPLTIYD